VSLVSLVSLQAEGRVHEFTPQEVANLLWAYAKLQYKPPHMLLVALWEGVGGGSSSSSGGSDASTRLSAFKPQELSMLVWALASLKVAPGKAWWEQFLQASYHKMQQQTPQVGGFCTCYMLLGDALSCSGHACPFGALTPCRGGDLHS
jgi:hypothetical protein